MKPIRFAASVLIAFSAAAFADEREDMLQMAAMAAQHQHDHPAATPAATTEPAQEVTAEEVTYGEVGGKPVKGYLARPKTGSGSLPGLIVIHEWWGVNDNIRAMTRRLAGEGYLALAVDLYGGATADNPDAAMKLVQATMANRAPAEENLKRAAAYLERNGAAKLGTVGWCFGGGWSLQAALLMPDQVDATVIYYGRVVADKEQLAKLRAPILGLFGDKDGAIPVDSVRAFEKTLGELGKPAEIHIYPGADHAFANSSGGNYNASAATDAWAKTTAFFKKFLR
jgi:carboxymethylenebutenolidase